MKEIKEFINNDLLEDSLKIFESEEQSRVFTINENIAKQIINPIFKRILDEKRILIVGDYDVDGMLSTIELKPYLELLAIRSKKIPKVETYYTKRELGYSMPEATYNNLQRKYDLIIFLDTGSSYTYFNKDTKNTIVIDHHPSENQQFLPFVFNPNNNGNFSTSTGKIIYDIIEKYEEMLIKKINLDRNKKKHDILKINHMLAGITLCSDMASMTAENKTFLDKSLYLMSTNKKVFCWLSDIPSKDITSLDLSFNIINKINSYSRMGKDLKEIEDIFLTKTSIAKARRISSSSCAKDKMILMNENHSKRKQVTSLLEKDLSDFLKQVYFLDRDVLSIVLDNRYTGINGLLSQNLLNRTSKPNIVISYDVNRDCYVGSGRGTGIKEALKTISNKENFRDKIKFGGHNEAIGVQIDYSIIDEFNLEVSRFRFNSKPISQRNDKYYLSKSIADFKKAVEHYALLSPKTNLDNRYYAIIMNYKNMGIVQKSNGWYCSSLCDEQKQITIYFKQHDLNKIKENRPVILEITNQKEKNYFIENKEVGEKMITEILNQDQTNNEGVFINVSV